MYPKSVNAKRDVETEDPQVPIDPFTEQVTHAKFQGNFQVLNQAMTIQANRGVVSPMKLILGTMTKRERDFTRLNPSKVSWVKS